MIKNLNLGWKIGGGFAVVLALAMLAGASGWWGLHSVEKQSIKNDVVTTLTDNMYLARLKAMYYIRSGQQADLDAFHAAGKTINESVGRNLHLFDGVTHKALAGFGAEVEEYRKEFDRYAEFEKSKEQATKAAIEASEELETALNALEKKLKTTISKKLQAFQGEAAKADFDAYVMLTETAQFFQNARGYAKDYLRSSSENNAEATRAEIMKVQTLAADLARLQASASESALTEQIRSAAEGYLAAFEVIVQEVEEQGKTFAVLGRLGKEALEHNTEITARQKVETEGTIEQSEIFIITGIILALLMGIAVSVICTRSVTNPVTLGVGFAQMMSSGDFTKDLEIAQKDEIGVLADALNHMADKLRGIAGEITYAAENVASGSEQLAATAETLANGATEQAAGVEEVSSSVEQMAANISQSAENAGATERIASQASEDAREGSKAVHRAVEAVNEIAEKISIVEEIARQTNLLALNAAIEAARAGEHGKGFAVVAAEVRKLAERSGTAAAEIGELSAATVGAASEAGEKLEQLVPDIGKTADLVQEISAATSEQNAGIDQINRAIQQLDQIVQQNASMAEEMASTSEELSGQAQQMQATMAFFKLNGNGRRQATRITAEVVRNHEQPHPSAAPLRHTSSGLVPTFSPENDMEFERL